MFSYCRSTTIRTLSAELVWPSVGRLLRLRQKYRDFETQKWWCCRDLVILLSSPATGEGGNHGCEGDFGKEVCREAERRGTRTA
jgi:hypothetical protein